MYQNLQYFNYWDLDIGDSEDGYIDDLRIRVDWYDEMTGYWFIKLVGYCTGLVCHGLILDVHGIGTIGWRISYCYMQYRYMTYWSVLDETVYWAVSGFVIV